MYKSDIPIHIKPDSDTLPNRKPSCLRCFSLTELIFSVLNLLTRLLKWLRVCALVFSLLQIIGLYNIVIYGLEALKRTRQSYRDHQAKQRQFYAMFVQQGDLCFDIGANIGDKTASLSNLGARVVAVEPQRFCIAMLRKRYSNQPNITVLHQAVAANIGEMQLFVANEHRYSTLSQDVIQSWLSQYPGLSQRSLGRRQRKIEHVPVTTLDSLIQHYGLPDFCKIDVEGFEIEVLNGLSQPLPCLSFEYNPHWIPKALQCVDRLTELGGYEFNYSAGETLSLVLPQWVHPEEIKKILATSLVDKTHCGDVYARLNG